MTKVEEDGDMGREIKLVREILMRSSTPTGLHIDKSDHVPTSRLYTRGTMNHMLRSTGRTGLVILLLPPVLRSLRAISTKTDGQLTKPTKLPSMSRQTKAI